MAWHHLSGNSRLIAKFEKGSRMYLITGGAGFIGSHIGEKLVAMGEKVRVLDNLSAGKRASLAGLEDKIEVIAGDILDHDALKKAAAGARVILHQAALRSVPF